AVLGDRVSTELLLSFLGAEPGQETECKRAVDDLVASGIAVTNEQALSLAHPVMHDVILATTGAEVRRELHGRARRVFSSMDAPVEVTAENAILAEELMTALVPLKHAAARAFARGDCKGAAHLLQRGLDLARQGLNRGELADPLAEIVIFARK